MEKNDTTLAELFEFNEGSVHSKVNKREVRSFELDGTTYFLKRNTFEGVKKTWRLLRQTPSARSSLDKERKLVELFEQSTLPVMRVAAYGERRFLGLPIGSLLVVRDVKGEPFPATYKKSKPTEKRKLAFVMGAFISAVHSAQIDSIVRVHDLFCTSKDYTDFRHCLVAIDREHGSLRKRPLSTQARASQLARIYIQSTTHCGLASRLELLAFLAGYRDCVAEAKRHILQRTLVHKIKKRLGKHHLRHLESQVSAIFMMDMSSVR